MDTPLLAIPAHEIVYMYTLRQSSTSPLLRRMLWHEAGVQHRATLDEFHAQQLGLDIAEGSILCQPWAMLEAVIDAALFESLGL